MKHPHASIIKQWLEDTTQEIELDTIGSDNKSHWMLVSSDCIFKTNNPNYKYRIKPKLDEYEFLRQAICDGKKIEYNNPVFDSKWRILSHNSNFILPQDRYRIYDPYREIKEAKERGERIVFQMSNGEWIDINDEGFEEDRYPSKRYRAAEKDIIECVNIRTHFSDCVNLRVTKSGIDGTIKAEVI